MIWPPKVLHWRGWMLCGHQSPAPCAVVWDSDGALSPLSATLQIGAGVLQPTEETTPIPFDSARSYFSYDPQTQSIDFAELSLVSKWVTARAEGVAFLGGLETGVLQDLVGQFRLTDLSLNPFEVYDAPCQTGRGRLRIFA